MKTWVVLGVAENNALTNSFVYLFSTRDRAIDFVERRLVDRVFTWSGDATETGGILDAHHHQEYGGRSVYQIWYARIDDEDDDAE
jgi:hypothetical protein